MDGALAELDAMTEVSLSKYEADLFMTASRAAVVTRRVAAALRARIGAAKVNRWRLVSNGLYREQVLDGLVGDAVARLYTEVHTRPGIANPRPSPALVRELSRAYRKRARGVMSIMRIAMKGLGLLFEDEPMSGRRLSPSVRGRQLYDRVMAMARTYLAPGGPIRDPRGVLEGQIRRIEAELQSIPGGDGLSDAERRRLGKALYALCRRSGITPGL